MKQTCLSIGLALYVALMVLQAWPPPDSGPAVRDSVQWAMPPFRALGMVQEWHMFVRPRPQNVNLDLIADIEFGDGSTATWTLPQPSRVPPLSRYRLGGRYHDWKYFFFKAENAALWPDMAGWVARSLYQPQHVPVRVILHESVAEVGLPPDTGDLPDACQIQPHRLRWRYAYDVAPGGLAVTAAWNRFWFEPVDPRPMALCRILYGVSVLAALACIAPDLLTFLGPRGFVAESTAWTLTGPCLSLLHWNSGTLAVEGLFGALTVAAVCLTVGLFTRASAVVVLLGLVSLYQRNPFMFARGDLLMRLLGLYLVFSPAGAAWSLDAWRSGQTPQPSPPWAQRLVQLQMTVMYGATLAWKLTSPYWLDGTAAYYTARLEDFWHFPVPYLFNHWASIHLITWGTLLVEAALTLLIWWRPCRTWVLGLGVLFHLGLEYSVNVPFFQWVVLAGLASFVDPAWLRPRG